jgi:hypothetical protein
MLSFKRFARPTIAICASVAWLLMFSAGILVDTIEQRRFLAPEYYVSQIRPKDVPPNPPSSVMNA